MDKDGDKADGSPHPASSSTELRGWAPKKRGIEEPFILLHQLECAAQVRQSLTDYYGLSEDLPWDRLVVRSRGDTPRNIYLISEGMDRIFAADERNLLRVINAGLTAFQHRKNPGAPNASSYQMHSTGIDTIAEFQRARIVDISYDELRAMILHPQPEYGLSLLSEATRALVEPFSVGPLTLRLHLPAEVSDWSPPIMRIGGWRGRGTLRLMVEQSQKEFFKYCFE